MWIEKKKYSATAFEAATAGTDYGAAIVPQYNGNIAGMVTSMLDNGQIFTEVQGRAFEYDQLYRIKQSLAFHMDGTALSTNTWQSSYNKGFTSKSPDPLNGKGSYFNPKSGTRYYLDKGGMYKKGLKDHMLIFGMILTQRLKR